MNEQCSHWNIYRWSSATAVPVVIVVPQGANGVSVSTIGSIWNRPSIQQSRSQPDDHVFCWSVDQWMHASILTIFLPDGDGERQKRERRNRESDDDRTTKDTCAYTCSNCSLLAVSSSVRCRLLRVGRSLTDVSLIRHWLFIVHSSLFSQPVMTTIDIYAASNKEVNHWYTWSKGDDEHRWQFPSPTESARLAQWTSSDQHRVSSNDCCPAFVCGYYSTTRSTRLESHLDEHAQHHLSQTRTVAWAHLFSRWTCIGNTLSHCFTSHPSSDQPPDRWSVLNRICVSCERVSCTVFIIVDRHWPRRRFRSLPR